MNPHELETAALRQSRRWLAQGQRREAEASLRQALAREANLPGVHAALAQLRWPGPDYRAWLAWLHQHLQPQVYVEIGVEAGHSLALVQPGSRVLAIDPAPVGAVGRVVSRKSGRRARRQGSTFQASPL